ncbi:helix-turn-helix transcriptional regulator [Pseudomonas aeruginosa]|uniref:helix-turn-helix transcriptional regulator n=1 Tax=Pseudomonas aeruginosa TaxID=287 RepID=UPI0009A3AB94|nr:AlpA family transcriptional regulator [Pseudomonas aeruginosa]
MRIIRLKEVMNTTGLARSTIYKYIGGGIFPKPINLAPSDTGVPSARCVGWIQSEIEDWISARINERNLAEVIASRAIEA